MDVLDDTDNLISSRIPQGAGTEVAADGILVPNKLLGKGFVNDSHVPRILVFVFVDGINNSVRIDIRKRMKKGAVDQAKDSRGRAYSQSQRKYCNERKPWLS